MQPFTIKAGVVFAVTGAALYFYFESEKRAVAARKAAETATAKIGRPKIGGPFVLQDQNGNNFSDKDLVGKWSLVYVSRAAVERAKPSHGGVGSGGGCTSRAGADIPFTSRLPVRVHQLP